MNEELMDFGKVEGMSVFFDVLKYRSASIHSDWEVLWITDGGLTVSNGDFTLEADEGDVVLIQPLTVQEYRSKGKSCTFLCLQMSPSFISQAPLVEVGCVKLNEHMTKGDIQNICKKLISITALCLRQPSYFPLACASHCNNLMFNILRKVPVRSLTKEEQANRDKRAMRLSRLLEFVDQNYNSAIRLSDFAEQESVSMNYLSHFVKDNLGQSFQDYVGMVRFDCAKKLIAKGELKLTEICRQAGFSDYKYFSNTFKKQCDMTPEEYQKSISSRGKRSEALREAESKEKKLSVQDSIMKIRVLSHRFSQEA